MTEILIPEFVEFMPEEKEEGILYISEKFSLAIHKCPCGCGYDSVLPIGPNGWMMTNENNEISFVPSILNKWCSSHFYITKNKIVWC